MNIARWFVQWLVIAGIGSVFILGMLRGLETLSVLARAGIVLPLLYLLWRR